MVKWQVNLWWILQQWSLGKDPHDRDPHIILIAVRGGKINMVPLPCKFVKVPVALNFLQGNMASVSPHIYTLMKLEAIDYCLKVPKHSDQL